MKINVFRLAGLFGSILSPLQAQERKEVAITSSGQPIVLPQQNAEVTASIYDVAPGVALPAHKRPYPMYAYVLSGNLRVTKTETSRSNTTRYQRLCPVCRALSEASTL